MTEYDPKRPIAARMLNDRTADKAVIRSNRSSDRFSHRLHPKPTLVCIGRCRLLAPSGRNALEPVTYLNVRLRDPILKLGGHKPQPRTIGCRIS
jgi:hypothetical protein